MIDVRWIMTLMFLVIPILLVMLVGAVVVAISASEGRILASLVAWAFVLIPATLIFEFFLWVTLGLRP